MFKNDGYNHIILDFGSADEVDITDPLFKRAMATGEMKVKSGAFLATASLVEDNSGDVIFFAPIEVDSTGAVATAISISTTTGDITTIETE